MSKNRIESRPVSRSNFENKYNEIAQLAEQSASGKVQGIATTIFLAGFVVPILTRGLLLTKRAKRVRASDREKRVAAPRGVHVDAYAGRKVEVENEMNVEETGGDIVDTAGLPASQGSAITLEDLATNFGRKQKSRATRNRAT